MPLPQPGRWTASLAGSSASSSTPTVTKQEFCSVMAIPDHLVIASLPQRTSESRQNLFQNSIKKDLSFKIAQAFYELRKIIFPDQL
jgi:hypothetical protein